jgi:antitoxin HicB
MTVNAYWLYFAPGRLFGLSLIGWIWLWLTRKRSKTAATDEAYTIVIQRLSPADGGGFLATVPDLLGCLSDGETREEAARNATDAIAAWIAEAAWLGRPAPTPNGESP